MQARSTRNALLGSALLGGVIATYSYSMIQVKQEDWSDVVAAPAPNLPPGATTVQQTAPQIGKG